jgi:hypothetical protein
MVRPAPVFPCLALQCLEHFALRAALCATRPLPSALLADVELRGAVDVHEAQLEHHPSELDLSGSGGSRV